MTTDVIIGAPKPQAQPQPQAVNPPTARPQKGKDVVRRIQGDRIKLAEHGRNAWRVRAPMEDDPETCLHPGYLWHEQRIRVGDIIEITNELNQFFIMLLVARIDRDTQSIQTRIIHACDWRNEQLEATDMSGATIERKGSDGWRVVLGTSIQSRGHASKQDAEQWLADRKLMAARKG